MADSGAVKRRIGIAKLFVALFSLGYLVTSYFGVWDALSGRAAAKRVLDKHWAAPTTCPDIQVCTGDDDFERFLAFVESQPLPEATRSVIKQGWHPACAVRMGYGFSADKLGLMGTSAFGVPVGGFMPDTLQVLLYYVPPDQIAEMNRQRREEHKCYQPGGFTYGFSLGELRDWIRMSRESERMYVVGGSVGLLSFLIALTEVFFAGGERRKNVPPAKSSAEPNPDAPPITGGTSGQGLDTPEDEREERGP
jgi:hypothetical protein